MPSSFSHDAGESSCTDRQCSFITALVLVSIVPSPRRPYLPGQQQLLKKPPGFHEYSRLDPSARPEPSLGRARTLPTLSRVDTTNSFSSGVSTPRTGRSERKRSLTEKIAIVESKPLDRGPWHPDSAYYVPRLSFRETLQAHDAEYKRRKDLRRLSRQLDGSRSRSNSLLGCAYRSNLSRNESFRSNNSSSQVNTPSRVSSLKHSETASTVSSVHSSVSARSSQLQRVVSASQNDRVPQRHDTQKQQLRESGQGEDRQQASPLYGGPGQRGLFGRHKSKNSRYVPWPRAPNTRH